MPQYKNQCLAIYSFNGPAVVWYSCNTGGNEEFTFKDGALCSKNGHCLTVKPLDPGKSSGVDAVQVGISKANVLFV